MDKNSKRLIWLIIGIIIFLSGCGQSASDAKVGLIDNPYQKTEIVMGTVVSLRIYDEGKKELLDKAFDYMEEFADITAVNVEGSEIDQINDMAGIEPVEVSEEVFNLVEEGIKHASKTGGMFDISIGPLTSLWSIGYDDARKPEQHEIEAVLPLIDFTKIEINEEEQTVYLKEQGMQLDLGGIAKGCVADLVADLLKEQGVSTAIIDLGGNIVVIGNNPSGNDWSIGIQNPLSTRGESVGKISAANQSIVTSGIYERVLEVADDEYHHLLSPEDGFPFMNELAGVSIVSKESIDGDALSTAAFAKGLQGGIDFIEEVNKVEAIFVTRENQIYLTNGLKGEFELTNEEFEMAQ